MIELKQAAGRYRQAEADLRGPWDLADLFSGPILVKASFGVQVGPSCVQPRTAEAATDYQ